MKRDWPNFKHFPEFALRALGNTCQDSGCPGRCSKAGRQEYDAGVLATDDYGLLGCDVV